MNRSIASYTSEVTGKTTRAYRDSDTGEYIVKLIGAPKADYFTDDKDDAIATMRAMADFVGVRVDRRRDPSKTLRLARKNLSAFDAAHGDDPSLRGRELSARLCLADAIKALDAGDYETAQRRALKSLAYTVGIMHPDYTSCCC